MHQSVHSAQILLHGNRWYNPRFTQQPETRFLDEATRITGVMRADSPDGIRVEPALTDIPFRLVVPRDCDYQAVNLEVWERLHSGDSLWDLDFTTPQRVDDRGTTMALAVFTVLGIAAVVSN